MVYNVTDEQQCFKYILLYHGIIIVVIIISNECIGLNLPPFSKVLKRIQHPWFSRIFTIQSIESSSKIILLCRNLL